MVCCLTFSISLIYIGWLRAWGPNVGFHWFFTQELFFGSVFFSILWHHNQYTSPQLSAPQFQFKGKMHVTVVIVECGASPQTKHETEVLSVFCLFMNCVPLTSRNNPIVTLPHLYQEIPVCGFCSCKRHSAHCSEHCPLLVKCLWAHARCRKMWKRVVTQTINAVENPVYPIWGNLIKEILWKPISATYEKKNALVTHNSDSHNDKGLLWNNINWDKKLKLWHTTS